MILKNVDKLPLKVKESDKADECENNKVVGPKKPFNANNAKKNNLNNKKENKINSICYNNDNNSEEEEDILSNIENINTSNISHEIIHNKINKKAPGNNKRNSTRNQNSIINNSLNVGYPINNLAAKNKAYIIKGIYIQLKHL